MNNIKSIIWEMIPGSSPVIAAAIHDGHDLRKNLCILKHRKFILKMRLILLYKMQYCKN